MNAPRTHTLHRAGTWTGAHDTVALSYDERFLRRKRLISDAGTIFFVDLPETVSLEAGDAFALPDGTHVAVTAAPEALLEVRGPALARLGAELVDITAPFTPEGGAYGHGRTMGHDHGDHDHAH